VRQRSGCGFGTLRRRNKVADERGDLIGSSIQREVATVHNICGGDANGFSRVELGTGTLLAKCALTRLHPELRTAQKQPMGVGVLKALRSPATSYNPETKRAWPI